MWVRLCMKHEIHVLPEKLTRFRVLDNEANTSGDRPDVHVRCHNELFVLLQSYLTVPNLQELQAIFPEAAVYDRGEHTDLHYAIARIALQLMPNSAAELFAIETLQRKLANPQSAAKLVEHYNFDASDFIELTGTHDPFNIVAKLQRNQLIARFHAAFPDGPPQEPWL
jgi:hypothetical protein